jgi:hypothetical protein
VPRARSGCSRTWAGFWTLKFWHPRRYGGSRLGSGKERCFARHGPWSSTGACTTRGSPVRVSDWRARAVAFCTLSRGIRRREGGPPRRFWDPRRPD